MIQHRLTTEVAHETKGSRIFTTEASSFCHGCCVNSEGKEGAIEEDKKKKAQILRGHQVNSVKTAASSFTYCHLGLSLNHNIKDSHGHLSFTRPNRGAKEAQRERRSTKKEHKMVEVFVE